MASCSPLSPTARPKSDQARQDDHQSKPSRNDAIRELHCYPATIPARSFLPPFVSSQESSTFRTHSLAVPEPFESHHQGPRPASPDTSTTASRPYPSCTLINTGARGHLMMTFSKEKVAVSSTNQGEAQQGLCRSGRAVSMSGVVACPVGCCCSNVKPHRDLASRILSARIRSSLS